MKKPKTMTCEAAQELSKTVGALIHWRPSTFNWLRAEQDTAVEVLSEVK